MQDETGTACAAKRAAEGRSRTIASVLPVVVFAICLYARSPRLFTQPRFWAEEGSLYYARLSDAPGLSGLTAVLNGNYQLLTNLCVAASTRVDPRYAAHVTTYLGFALAAVCAWLIGRIMRRWGCSVAEASIACALWALQPAGYEIFLNATNVQWISSLIALMLCLEPDARSFDKASVVRLVGLAACGLNGITTCILLPIFCCAAAVRRDRYSIAMACVVGACTVVQLAVVVAHRGEIDRPFEVSMTTAYAWAVQVVDAPFLRPKWILEIRNGLGGPLAGTVLLGSGLCFCAALLIVVRRHLETWTTGVLALGIVGVPLVNALGATETPSSMMSPFSGGRYFFLGATCIILSMTVATRYLRLPFKMIPGVALALAGLNALQIARTAGVWSLYTHGSSVAAQVDACAHAETCLVTIWPEGAFPPLKISRGTGR